MAVAQSSSLNLFANRDVELEQRAMLLKRLAFAIFSSEVDQYQKYLPDIQGKKGAYISPLETNSDSSVRYRYVQQKKGDNIFLLISELLTIIVFTLNTSYDLST